MDEAETGVRSELTDFRCWQLYDLTDEDSEEDNDGGSWENKNGRGRDANRTLCCLTGKIFSRLSYVSCVFGICLLFGCVSKVVNLLVFVVASCSLGKSPNVTKAEHFSSFNERSSKGKTLQWPQAGDQRRPTLQKTTTFLKTQ